MYKANGSSNEHSHPDIGVVDDSVMIRAGLNPPHVGGSDSNPSGSNTDNEGDPPESQGDETSGPDSAGSNHIRLTGAGIGELHSYLTGVVVGVEEDDRVRFTGTGIGEHIATATDHHLPQNDWCEDDCNNPDGDKTDNDRVSFNDAVNRAGFVELTRSDRSVYAAILSAGRLLRFLG